MNSSFPLSSSSIMLTLLSNLTPLIDEVFLPRLCLGACALSRGPELRALQFVDLVMSSRLVRGTDDPWRCAGGGDERCVDGRYDPWRYSGGGDEHCVGGRDDRLRRTRIGRYRTESSLACAPSCRIRNFLAYSNASSAYRQAIPLCVFEPHLKHPTRHRLILSNGLSILERRIGE